MTSFVISVAGLPADNTLPAVATRQLSAATCHGRHDARQRDVCTFHGRRHGGNRRAYTFHGHWYGGNRRKGEVGRGSGGNLEPGPWFSGGGGGSGFPPVRSKLILSFSLCGVELE